MHTERNTPQPPTPPPLAQLATTLPEKGDPAWLLRTARLFSEQPEQFAALRTLPVYADLCDAAKEQCAKLHLLGLQPLALRSGLEEILLLNGAPAGLQWLLETGALAGFLPEVHATVDFSQEAGRRHKDVWEHTKQVVAQAEPRPAVRWAALLHDIGKVRTRSFTSDGKVTFHRHSEVGARMFDDIGPRLGFDNAQRRSLRFLILHHLRPNQYLETWTDSAVRRFTKEMGGYLPDLLDLSRADITSRRPGRRQQAILNIDGLANRLGRLREQDATLPLLPSGIGDAIMKHFGLPPSRLIGDLKRALEQSIEAGELEARLDCSEYLPHVEQLLAKEKSEPCLCHE